MFERRADYPAVRPRRLAFLGLGVMGAPMAAHLAAAGHEVTVYNRTRSKAEDWVATYGGRFAPTPRQATEGADAVLSCVGNDTDVRAVLLGPDGACAGLSAGALVIDHTTASARLAVELSERAAALGLRFLDAPVSGGQAGAEKGRLSVMCGGDEETFAAARDILAAYAASLTLIGPAGSGQLAKMCNQICIAGVVQGLSEAIAFGENAGLDMTRVIAAISGGAAGSWQMRERYRTMLERRFDFGFAVDWMRKDLGIALAEAHRNGSSLPLTELVDGFYREVQERGGGRLDTSALLLRLPGRPARD